ncbi:cyclic GMP-AMP synthase-like protein [Drosophila biarmipes]|uniref:cyclic GMP-AMP synthase-like protein n=1 Tax=Drosophila biarmipes TaxID=125945 RepID=UPI0007E80013|nr:cyclic GMP-AMP synthase-like protein [Drosophila biarmipes]
MSGQNQIKEVLRSLQISDEDRCEYTSDAIAIQNHVIDELKNKDSAFRSAYDGLSLGGSYLDRVKLTTPDEFDLHMKLKFPFQITPNRDENGFIFLYAPGGRHSQIVGSDGYIRRQYLQDWLRGIFKQVFNPTLRLKSDRTGNTYTVSYTLEGYGCAHSIEAKCGDRIIAMDLVPAFEFEGSQWPFANPPVPWQTRSQYPWFAIPQKKPRNQDDRTFMVCAPHWEREVMKGSYNMKNVLRLMKGLRDGNSSDLPHLSSYMLKSVLLQEIQSVNWKRDEAPLLVEMWGKLVYRLNAGRLDFFLADGHNIFDRLNERELSICRSNASRIYQELRVCNGSQLYNLFKKN